MKTTERFKPIDERTIKALAARVSVCMFSLLWEGDYNLSRCGGPGEDELYDTALDAIRDVVGIKR